ncbi:hypothetical protein AbraIFM66951_006066 [Aspergillus brasiliensis]|uniref:Uncharacterized protein n=1 Tax=Aspergillus brasiliensis TaxID=319629 RepID=A0A9W5YYV9_9EURO|nr:hypothetical protein AbraCBS73388_011362 [Aspergillus brasiliensis]GKZ44226.1 hypothetical protein AbraIFM66951_006066 [Aspergillus brasiliensis]
MKFLTLAIPATLLVSVGVVAMPIPSTSKAARLSGQNLFDALGQKGGIPGLLSDVHMPFLNPSPKTDGNDTGDGDEDAGASAGADAGAGVGGDKGPGAENPAGVGAGGQDGAGEQ